jgi:hypothetical protein
MTRATVAMFVLAAGAALAVSASAAAQGASPSPRPAAGPKTTTTAKAAANPSPLSFAGMDRNADNRVSEEEFRNALAFVFAGQDANHDEVVTRAEVERNGPDAVKMFDAFDSAIDTETTGQIELGAFLDFGLSVFRSADTDGDGVVTVAERDALRAKVKAEGAARKP